MVDLKELKPIKIEGTDVSSMANVYSFNTPSGISVKIDTSPERKTNGGRFQESVHAYSVEKNGIVYPLAGGGLTQKSINEVRTALAGQKQIPSPIRKEFKDMLDNAKVAPEPKRRIEMM